MAQEDILGTVPQGFRDKQVSSESGDMLDRGEIPTVSGEIEKGMSALLVGGNSDDILIVGHHGKTIQDRRQISMAFVYVKEHGEKYAATTLVIASKEDIVFHFPRISEYPVKTKKKQNFRSTGI